MSYVLLYFLVGAIVAVWMAILQARREALGGGEEAKGSELVGAYIMIGLAWPLALGAFTYSLIAQAGEDG